MKILLPVIASTVTYAAVIGAIAKTGLLAPFPLPPFSLTWHYWAAVAAAPTRNILEVFLPVWGILIFWLWLLNR